MLGRRPVALLLLTGALVSLAGTGRATPRARVLPQRDANSAATKDPVPEVVIDVESSAEDLVDVALARDRKATIRTAGELRARANGPAAAALSASGVPAGDVAELRFRAVRAAQIAQHGRFVDVALAANAVSQLMPSLYSRFRSRVPSSIFALDYLDREVHLRSLARQQAKVAAAIVGLERTWRRVRPKVRAAGGRIEASAFDRHVRALIGLRPGSTEEVQAEALRGLELVDELERVFAR